MRGGWRPNRTATYWPPLLWPSRFLSRSPDAAQPEAQGPTPLGPNLLHRILSSTGLVFKLDWSPNCSIRSPEGPFCRVLAFSTASSLQRTDFLSSPSYIIFQRPLLLVGVTIVLTQPIHGQGYNSDTPRPDAPVIYIGAFPILTARPGRRSIYNKCCFEYKRNHGDFYVISSVESQDKIDRWIRTNQKIFKKENIFDVQRLTSLNGERDQRGRISCL